MKTPFIALAVSSLVTSASAHMHEHTPISEVDQPTSVSKILIDQHQHNTDKNYWPTKIVSMLDSRGIEITEDKLNAFFIEAQ